MLLTFAVSIGRNVGGSTIPLPKVAWEAFIRETTATVDEHRNKAFFEGEGLGINPYSSPVTYEDSYTIIGDIFTDRITDLERALAKLAPLFDQKSIALTIGDTRFPGEDE